MCSPSTYQHLIDSLVKLPRVLRHCILKSDGTMRHALRGFILSGSASDLGVGVEVICSNLRGIPGYEELCEAVQWGKIPEKVAALMHRISQFEIMKRAIRNCRCDILRMAPHMALGNSYRRMDSCTYPLEYASSVARLMCSRPKELHDVELAELRRSPALESLSYTYLAIDYVSVYTLFGGAVATLRRGDSPIHRLVRKDGDNAIAHRIAMFTLG